MVPGTSDQLSARFRTNNRLMAPNAIAAAASATKNTKSFIALFYKLSQTDFISV